MLGLAGPEAAAPAVPPPLFSPAQHIVALARELEPLDVVADGHEEHRPVEQGNAAGQAEPACSCRRWSVDRRRRCGSAALVVVVAVTEMWHYGDSVLRAHCVTMLRDREGKHLPRKHNGEVSGGWLAGGGGPPAGLLTFPAIMQGRTCPERWAICRPSLPGGAPAYRRAQRGSW